MSTPATSQNASLVTDPSPPASQVERHESWRRTLFSGICGADSFQACLGSWFCSDCLYGKVDDRLRLWPDIEAAGVHPRGLGQGCVLNALAKSLGFYGLMTMFAREGVRRRFGIEGGGWGDCLFCTPCVLAQLNTELKVRAHETREGYNSRGESMVYVAPAAGTIVPHPGPVVQRSPQAAIELPTTEKAQIHEPANPASLLDSIQPAHDRLPPPALIVTPASLDLERAAEVKPLITTTAGEPVSPVPTAVNIPRPTHKLTAAVPTARKLLTTTTTKGEPVTVHLTDESRVIAGPIGPPPPGSVERPVVAVED